MMIKRTDCYLGEGDMVLTDKSIDEAEKIFKSED